MSPSPQNSPTFNGPLEAGVRAVAILHAFFPESLDIERMTACDYLLVHTKAVGGPDDLHPSTPIATPGTEVRRKIVQKGLSLMMTRDLVQRAIETGGIRYRAGESAAYFLGALTSPYMAELNRRAAWLATHLRHYTDDEFRSLMRRFFDNWVVEFQAVEQSLGAQA